MPKSMGASRKKKKEKDFTQRTRRHGGHREEKADSSLRSE
jgi:hypothetical protein